jgi:hypothetical protein
MKLNFHKRAFAFHAVVVVCVLLALLTGFIGAVHVHPASTNAAESSCPTCALAHAGAVRVELGHVAPVFIASGTLDEIAQTSHSFVPESSLYIRPPPLV